MNGRFNGLSHEEDEMLALLAEECAEVIVAAEKVRRHGWSSHNPDIKNSPNNRQNLEKEIGHVGFATELLTQDCTIDRAAIIKSALDKRRQIQRSQLTDRPLLHHITV